MANNVQAETVVTPGVRFLSAEVTYAGDASTHTPGCFLGIVSGAEGSQTFTEYVGGAGAVTAGTQRVTLASDDPAVALLTTIDADTSTLAGAVSGTEMQVDIVAALPAGTNAIGKLAANSGVDIGDVDVTSIIPGTGATNLGKAIDTATGATDTGVLALATRDDALSALTPIEGDNVQLRTDANGALWVIPSGTVTVAGTGTFAVQAVCTNAGTFAVQAAQSGTWNITNVSGTISLPTGAATAAKQPALGTAGTASTDVITVQGIAAMTPLLVTLSGTNEVTNAGTFAVQAAQSGTWTVQPGNTANTTAWLVTGTGGTFPVTDSGGSLTADVPAVATGGATPGKLISAATTNATSVKGSAGTLYMLTAMNTNAAARYLKFYNKATAPTVGTDTPVLVFTIPGNTAGAGFVCPIPTCGIEFSTGIGLATTTGAADSDTGAVAANEIVVSYSYK